MSKRTLALFGILFITASSLPGCGKKAKTPAYDPHSALESSIVAQYAFTEYTSLSEAAENIGFSIPPSRIFTGHGAENDSSQSGTCPPGNYLYRYRQSYPYP